MRNKGRIHKVSKEGLIKMIELTFIDNISKVKIEGGKQQVLQYLNSKIFNYYYWDIRVSLSKKGSIYTLNKIGGR